MSKNVQTTIQLHSLYTLTRLRSKSFKLGFSICEPSTPRCTSWVYKRQRNQRSNCQHSLEHGESKGIPENIYFCFIDYAKSFDCVDHNKLWKTVREIGVPDHLTCLLRNLYAGQEAKVRSGHGTKDWFQIGKGVCQGCMLSPCLFKLNGEDIIRNAKLDEAQAGIKITGRSINNLRHVDDTTFMVSHKHHDTPKSLLMKVTEESENAGLKLSI